MTGPVDDHLKLVGRPQPPDAPSVEAPEELELPLEAELPELALEAELPELALEPELPELLLEPELPEPPLDPDAPVDPELPLLDPPLAGPPASGEELDLPLEPQPQNVAVAAATAKRARAPMRDLSLPSWRPLEGVSSGRAASPGIMGSGAKNLLTSRAWRPVSRGASASVSPCSKPDPTQLGTNVVVIPPTPFSELHTDMTVALVSGE
jgi:hypothetical protein